MFSEKFGVASSPEIGEMTFNEANTVEAFIRDLLSGVARTATASGSAAPAISESGPPMGLVA